MQQDALDALERLRTNDTTLTELDLRWIGLRKAVAVAGALERNTTLMTLNLRDNGLGEAGGAAVAGALERNTTLTTLDLGSHRLGEAGGAAVAGALERNTTLTTLDLGNLHDLPGYHIPNRKDVTGVVRDKKLCLDHVNINVLATPFNVSVDEDWASGTEGQLFQMYLLSEAVPSKGFWYLNSTCGNTTIRMTVVRKDFMVNYKVFRSNNIISLFAKLLGSVAGIANAVQGVVAAYFKFLNWYRGNKNPQQNELLTLSVDENDTGGWFAQRHWNQKFDLKHEESAGRIKTMEGRIRASESRIELLMADLVALRDYVYSDNIA